MKRGFTLIELLISITIFSILIALAAYSFRFNIGIIRKVVMPYPKQAMNFSYLNDALKSIFYFVGEKRNMIGNKKFFIYFYGEKNMVKFITTGKNGPMLCKLYLDNDTLKLDRVDVYAKYNDYKNPYFPKNKTKSVALMKDVENLDISYLENGTLVHRVKKEIPDMIKISLVQNGKQWTFYFKVKSNFRKKKDYAEYFYALSK